MKPYNTTFKTEKICINF